MNTSLLYTGIAAMIIMSSCHRNKADDGVKTTFVLSDTMMASIRLDTARTVPVQGELHLYGKTIPNGNHITRVFSPADGQVQDMKVAVGEHVDKGQVLMAIQHITDGSNEGSAHLVTAPVSGYVTEENVHDSMDIKRDNGKQLLTISELNELWVTVDMSGSDTTVVKEGSPVRISTVSEPGKIYPGKIIRCCDPDKATNTMVVRVQLEGSGLQLKPRTPIVVTLRYPSGGAMTAIPSASVINDKNRHYVMVFRDKYNIDTREVHISRSLDDITYIQAGLKAGEKVVSKNQLLIYDAINE